MSGRRRFGALLVALAGLLCVACIPSKPLRLGFIGGLSGPVADLGESGRDGALLAVEEINAAGGIGGRRVELHLIDDGQDEEQAAAAVETLAREGVELIIGPLTSAMGVAALPVAERLGVLLVSPTITASRFVGRDDQLLLVSPHVGEITRRFAVHLHAQGVRRLALAYDTRNLAFSADWALHLREALRALGTEVVAEVPFVSGEFASYETSLRELLAAHPDALHFVASAVDTVRLLQVVRLLHVDLPSSAAAWAATEHLIQLGHQAMAARQVKCRSGQFGTDQIPVAPRCVLAEQPRRAGRDIPAVGGGHVHQQCPRRSLGRRRRHGRRRGRRRLRRQHQRQRPWRFREPGHGGFHHSRPVSRMFR